MNKVLLVLGIILLSVTSFAGGGSHHHDHEAAVEAAPHGGILRNSNPYKNELVLNKDHAKMYIYTNDLKQVPKERLGATAVGEVKFPKDKKKREIVFKLVDGVYEATIKGIDKVHRYDMHIDVMVDGKKIVADFGVDNIH